MSGRPSCHHRRKTAPNHLDVKVSAAAGLTQVMDLAANCQIARIIVNEAALRY
jgi:hypothetical protein